MRRLIAASLLVPGLAAAQDLTTHDKWMIEPVPGTYYERGVGSPTVAYDRKTDRWVMYFETQFGAADAPGGQCDEGRWGLGRATSVDGINWTVDPELRVEPQADSYYSCVVAHPKIIFDGELWHLWFKGQQQSNGCSGTPPSWGCREITGVGYATSADGVNWDITDTPILSLGSFGFPAVVKVDGTYRMLLSYSNAANGVYELWQSVSSDDGATWSTPEVVIQPGFASWVEDEIYNPALTCSPELPNPYILWAGGRNIRNNSATRVIETAGIGRAVSSDAITWPWDVRNPYLVWDLDPPAGQDPDRDWRHWDVMRIGDDYLLYFSQRNDAGRNRIGLAYTYNSQKTSFDELRMSDKICVIGEDTGTPDTDPGDSDPTTSDTDTTDTDDTAFSPTPPPGDDGKCGCDSGAGSLGALAPLALLTMVRRRRR